jgi:RNA polymerase sigma factor (TIGR02999 family)
VTLYIVFCRVNNKSSLKTGKRTLNQLLSLPDQNSASNSVVQPATKVSVQMSETPQNVTQLLIGWGKGDKEALDQLLPLVYDELRRQAARYLRRERPGHTLQTTALIHEAYIRLVDQKRVQWQNRAHFFGIAAQLMRRILVDHARSRHRVKRGGSDVRVSLAEASLTVKARDLDVLAIDEALDHLAQVDERQAKVVELRFFSGLSVEETAEVLQISPATVKREWSMAKAWLHREISNDQS